MTNGNHPEGGESLKGAARERAPEEAQPKKSPETGKESKAEGHPTKPAGQS